MKTRAELKDDALEDLNGFWKGPVVATLIYLVIAVIFSGRSNVGYTNGELVANNVTTWNGICLLVSLFFILPMSYSYLLLFLDFIRGEKEKVVGKLFAFFKHYGRALGTAFLVALYTYFWSLLLIIPGIIMSLAYSMTYFISKDHPEYSIDECIEASKKMMYGHKWELFVLYLSFIGWFLLAILTFCIGFLWLSPYFRTTIAHYYEELKAETEALPA